MVDSKNILEKLDIVDVVSRYISLSKKGSDYIGICPFHDDHSPSLHVSKDKQIFKCFTCGVGGNAISFISNYEHISYREALYKAAEIAGIKLVNNERVIPHKTEKDCMKTFVDYYKMSIELNSNSNGYIDQYYIDFFIKPPSYSESFSNQTTESAFASMLDSGSNMMKEFAFLTTAAGTSSALMQQNLNTYINQKAAELKMVSEDGVINRFMNRLLTGSATILSGGNLVFPNIWQNSSYNRDFNVEITLATPYGDKESIFLEIFVPMMFLVALVLPRQATVNSYVTPFMVRANVPGFFTCDMGMVRDMQITRGGANGDAWAVNGLPTEVTVSMNIEDLYSSLSMSNFTSKKNIYNFLYNSALFDYIGNQCGLNMKSSEWQKKIDLLKALTTNLPSDLAEYTSMYAAEGAASSMAKIMAAK